MVNRDSTQTERKSRRNFLAQATLAWLVLIVVIPIYGVIKYLMPQEVADDMAATLDVGKIFDIPIIDNGVKLLKYNRKAIFLYRNDQGQVKALSAVCTHLGCIVQYHPENRTFKCNCHGSVFNLDGTNVSGPAPKPLAPYRVDLKKDEVIVYPSQTA